MKAKLILKKHNDCYSLNDYREPSKGYPLVIAHSGDENFRYKLSKQNCDSLFGVIDVEKLACEYCNNIPLTLYEQDIFSAGFNKALELNKDKVFTLEDMYDAVMLGVCFEDSGIQGISTYEELKELAIKRASKPTEIEVMIVMECDGIQTGLCSEDCDCNVFPKLDSEGCLILNKI